MKRDELYRHGYSMGYSGQRQPPGSSGESFDAGYAAGKADAAADRRYRRRVAQFDKVFKDRADVLPGQVEMF